MTSLLQHETAEQVGSSANSTSLAGQQVTSRLDSNSTSLLPSLLHTASRLTMVKQFVMAPSAGVMVHVMRLSLVLMVLCALSSAWKHKQLLAKRKDALKEAVKQGKLYQ